jgi:hypothetical protein
VSASAFPKLRSHRVFVSVGHVLTPISSSACSVCSFLFFFTSINIFFFCLFLHIAYDRFAIMAYIQTQILVSRLKVPADETSHFPRSSAWSQKKQEQSKNKARQDERLLPSHPAIEEEAGRCCPRCLINIFCFQQDRSTCRRVLGYDRRRQNIRIHHMQETKPPVSGADGRANGRGRRRRL